MKSLKTVLVAAFALGAAVSSYAEVKVGVSISLTGQAASAGISQQKALATLPTKAGAETIVYKVLDDASDPTKAAQNAQKLISEEHVDVLFGSTATPPSLAMAQFALENKTPLVTLAPVQLTPEMLPWTFVMSQPSSLMVDAIVAHMQRNRVKTVAFIGYSDSFGEAWLRALTSSTQRAGITIVATERFARTDTSVLTQTLKLVAANPDAVSVGATTTAAALPQRALRERVYKGPIYHTHGAASADFLRAAGASGAGAFVPAGPLLAAEQLPTSNPVRAAALDFVRAYETANGPQSRTVFASNLSDAAQFLANAISSAAPSGAKPGTPEFRAALRTAMEQTKALPLANGLVTNSKSDHNGFDKTGVVLLQVVDGQWHLEEQLARVREYPLCKDRAWRVDSPIPRPPQTSLPMSPESQNFQSCSLGRPCDAGMDRTAASSRPGTYPETTSEKAPCAGSGG